LNVALYGRGGHRWAMTERGRKAVTRETGRLAIGPSAVAWEQDSLVFDLDEITVLWPSRIEGRVRLVPKVVTDSRFALDHAGRHRWWPVAPCARIEVELRRPAIRWSGTGYFDINHSDEPLENGFSIWHWARASFDGGRSAALLYDITERNGKRSNVALTTDKTGAVSETEPPKTVRLPRTRWLMPRAAGIDEGGRVCVKSTLEDTPFYARSLLSMTLMGRETLALHESLSLDRFRTQLVKSMLPYRMPRRFF
jgi:carotenoid 1,2-hydratase